jgi:hypothetical protein
MITHIVSILTNHRKVKNFLTTNKILVFMT